MWRNEFAQFAPRGPVTVASALGCASDDVRGNERQDKRVPPYSRVPPVLWNQVEQPRHGGGLPVGSTRRTHLIRPARRHVPERPLLGHAVMIRNKVLPPREEAHA